MFWEKYEPASNPAHPEAKAADWAKVGGNTPTTDLNNPDKDKRLKWKNEVWNLTIEEMQKFVDTWNFELSKFLKDNPDAAPAINWKQTSDLAKAQLDTWMNSIYP